MYETGDKVGVEDTGAPCACRMGSEPTEEYGEGGMGKPSLDQHQEGVASLWGNKGAISFISD